MAFFSRSYLKMPWFQINASVTHIASHGIGHIKSSWKELAFFCFCVKLTVVKSQTVFSILFETKMFRTAQLECAAVFIYTSANSSNCFLDFRVSKFMLPEALWSRSATGSSLIWCSIGIMKLKSFAVFRKGLLHFYHRHLTLLSCVMNNCSLHFRTCFSKLKLSFARFNVSSVCVESLVLKIKRFNDLVRLVYVCNDIFVFKTQ